MLHNQKREIVYFYLHISVFLKGMPILLLRNVFFPEVEENVHSFKSPCSLRDSEI